MKAIERAALLTLLVLCAALVLALPESRPVAPLVVPFGGWVGYTVLRGRP